MVGRYRSHTAVVACLSAKSDFRHSCRRRGVKTSVPISCPLKFKFLRAPKYAVVKHLCLVEAYEETPVLSEGLVYNVHYRHLCLK